MSASDNSNVTQKPANPAAEFVSIDSGSVDAVLDALVVLTRLHHRPFSAESLTAGLPLAEGKLTPDLFIRAANNAGFAATFIKRTLAEIAPQVLPAAIVLNNGEVAILIALEPESARWLPAENFTADDLASQVQDISLEQLTSLYEGHCYLFKPEPSLIQEATPNPDANWFWEVIRKSRGIYLEVLVASFLINLFALVSPLFVMNVYDRVVPNYATETLWVLSSGVAIVFVFDLIMKSLRGYFIDVAGKRADILLSSKTFARVMDIRMKDRPARVGSFASNLQEFDTFREFFTSTTLIALIDLPFTLLFVLLIFGIGGSLALVPLIAIPLTILLGVLLQSPLATVINETFAESSKKHAMLIESLTALDAIKGSRAEGVMQRRWESFNARLAKLALKSRLMVMTTMNLVQLIQQLSTVAIVIMGVYAIMEGLLSVGGLIACTILTGRCLAPMGQVAAIFTRYHHSKAAFQSINRMMHLPVERPQGHKFLHRPRLDGEIRLANLSFTYAGQQVPALKNINISISAGEKVAIIGKTGSGKTTLQKLLMNFYQPTEGSIFVSGTDINQLDPTELRGNISYVPQDIMLLDGTIRENIVLSAPLSTDSAVIKSAELAGIADFINRHPQGYDLKVGERGSNLSGGQRQGVTIARALISEAPIVLMDEPTTSMDSTTEALFQQRFKLYLANKTMILITHKASMLALVDRLIVLNDGQVVADGPKQEVLNALAGRH